MTTFYIEKRVYDKKIGTYRHLLITKVFSYKRAENEFKTMQKIHKNWNIALSFYSDTFNHADFLAFYYPEKLIN